MTGAYEPLKAAKECVATVPSKYKLPTYFHVLIRHVHASAIAHRTQQCVYVEIMLYYNNIMMADTDEIVWRYKQN